MALIKSHSNYVLKKKHQEIEDGTIWERDITTIGGVNQFSPGQIPIYKSSNFIITVRNDGKVSNQYNQTKWKANEDSDIWTIVDVANMSSDFEDQNDVKIVLKNDYYDFCDFAYYGSLTEMFRASINDILERFPGELYRTDSNRYYTSATTEDFEVKKTSVLIGEPKFEGVDPIAVDNKRCYINLTASTRIVVDDSSKYVDNPFGINVHSAKKPVDGDEIKYFADGGYKNYDVIDTNGNTTQITNWKTRNFIKCIKYEQILDLLYGRDAFYYNYLKPTILQQYFDQPNNEVWWVEASNDNEVTEKSIYNGSTYKNSSGYTKLEQSFTNGAIRREFNKYQSKYWIEKSDGSMSNFLCISMYDGEFYDTKEEAEAQVPPRDDWEEGVTYEVKNGGGCCEISCYIDTPCKGYKTASTTANTYIIDTWIGDANKLIYMSEDSLEWHIRPKNEFFVKFYNECDNFEKIIMNYKTTPKFKSTFSVIRDNEVGYYREMQDFVFPTSYGGYNLDVSSDNFNKFTERLYEIGAYYDSIFTDNLYRAMTHEAIKNFDWTYTREYNDGDENEYRTGGEKMQKALRVFAREFDEILTYIDNIKNINRVTYDERNNIPNYFLVDEARNKGWDICLVYPYELEEYYYSNENQKTDVEDENYTAEVQLKNTLDGKHITRQFTQNAKKEIYPYSKNDKEYQDGYFVICGEGDTPCWYDGIYSYKSAANSGSTYYDERSKKLVNKIKSYRSDKPYTYFDANNEFMRRLAINSPFIWRHKGTIEGIEMILGMFGLKSKRWVDRLTPNCINDDVMADYEIIEYSSLTSRIEEKWDAVHQMYRMDWINSTKSIVYDYRTMSNYTSYGAPINYISYQGLPVLYRYENLQYQLDGNGDYVLDENGEKILENEPYIKVSPLSGQESTSSVTESFKNINEDNSAVRRRYLYPNFDKGEQLDGNPYFQMNGGWLSKTVQNNGKPSEEDNSSNERFNFQYDVDDNIAYTCYVKEGKDENEEIVDNHPIYKETVRNIQRVDSISDLISTPIDSVKDGTIIYVSNIERNVAVIDNEVFMIKYEYSEDEDGGKTLRYVSMIKGDEYIRVGDSKFFTNSIVVYDKNGEEAIYNLLDKENGYEVKAYIKTDENGNPDFICKSNFDGAYTIDSFMTLDDEFDGDATNYFIIDDSFFSNRLSSDNNNEGWRRLKKTDTEYIKINTIKNYYEGNNPHNGNIVYDNGHEYFTYFKRLFKNAIDDNLFDERCYESFYNDLSSEIVNYGFKNLVHENELIKQYDPYLISGDSKIHYFGNYYKNSPNQEIMFYGDNKNKLATFEKMYKTSINSKISVMGYKLDDEVDGNKKLSKGMIGGTSYKKEKMKEKDDDTIIDDITNQIVNNKRLTIKFYLHKPWFSKQGQCELKYLDDVVMNYLTQMIPSTSIVDIEYVSTQVMD